MSLAVALLSPGDMGHVVARVLGDHGMPVLTCLQGRSERTRRLARKAGVETVPTYRDLVREADLILSILVPAQAFSAARKVAEALEPGQTSLLYVDCNAVSPATALAIEGVIAARGEATSSTGALSDPLPASQGAPGATSSSALQLPS